MKCRCGNEIDVKLGTKINAVGCNVLTNLTTIATIQCSKCKKVFQIPIMSKSVFSVKKDNE